ncbi:MAG TPA: aminoglycoside phosphotransferase family protein [Ktedonobacter sp.]|nr:aminoglycoside phosphotransferase family protein [Ktedonobacter sp.]
MREQPQISIDRLKSYLQEQYGLFSVEIDFLALGLDYNAGVYRVKGLIDVEGFEGEQEISYFLKVKAGTLYEPGCLVSAYLCSHGITKVVAPILTRNRTLWTQIDNWTIIVYPYIEGDTSWSGMTDEQWKETGAIFKHIHQAPLLVSGFESIRKETFDVMGYSRWIHAFKAQHIHAENDKNVSDARQVLLASWRRHQITIDTAIRHMEKLAAVLQKQSLPYVICHADLHPANLIRDRLGHVHVIDWDEVMLAPKERDFIFVRETPVDTSMTASIPPFFQGYGQTEINWIALTYYRYERVIQDVIECTREVFFKEDVSEEARVDAAQLFDEVLSRDGEMETALKTAMHLPKDLTRM